VHTKIMKVYKTVLRVDIKTNNFNDEQILNIHELVRPCNLIVMEQVSLFVRVLSRGTKPLLVAIAAAWSEKDNGPRSWLPAATSAVTRLALEHSECSEFAACSVAQMCQTVSAAPKHWKNVFRKCLSKHVRDPYINLEVDGGGKVKNKTNDPYNVISAHEHVCKECNSGFASSQQLGAHAFRKHGLRGKAAQWTHGTICWVCGMNYFTISRVRQHLEKKSNGPCLTRMIAHNVTVSCSKILEINAQQNRESAELARNGFKPHHATKLAVRVFGPVLGRSG
jgi:hypothetical protein